MNGPKTKIKDVMVKIHTKSESKRKKIQLGICSFKTSLMNDFHESCGTALNLQPDWTLTDKLRH